MRHREASQGPSLCLENCRAIRRFSVYSTGLNADGIYTDILSNFGLLERAVAEFDARFTLRALRSISSLRKRLSQSVLCQAIASTYPPNSPTARTLFQATGVDDATLQTLLSQAEQKAREDKHNSRDSKEVVPEIDIYVGILIQVSPTRKAC